MKPKEFSSLRLNRAAYLLAFLAIFTQALFPAGWMPAFASAAGQGLSIIICTSAGISHVQIGADGQPIKEAPEQGAKHDHQCCPCAGSRPLTPPSNIVVAVLRADTGESIVFPASAENKPVALIPAPHSPRAPPFLA